MNALCLIRLKGFSLGFSGKSPGPAQRSLRRRFWDSTPHWVVLKGLSWLLLGDFAFLALLRGLSGNIFFPGFLSQAGSSLGYRQGVSSHRAQRRFVEQGV